MGKAPNTIEDFLLLVHVRQAGCWTFLGGKTSKGYGQFARAGKKVPAHRFAYETFVGRIPAGMFVCHSCDNPQCVRPSHLWLGTAADNSADMKAKLRSARGLRNAKNKITPQQVIEIRRLWETGLHSKTALAKRFSVHATTIRNIVERRQWVWL